MNRIATITPADRLPVNRGVCALSLVLMLAGILRLLVFVLHDPLLAYANNYDMIRLQACHQIWPADPQIAVDRGTPDAPILSYTRTRHVETSCLYSSELFFTGLGVWLAEMIQSVDEPVLSIRAIGIAKAAVLLITSTLGALFFLRQRRGCALLAHALVFSLVLCDPGVTLYLHTFYSEFSAVYFLYLTLLGLAFLSTNDWQWRYALPVLAGLAGLGLSKAQHLPLAILAGSTIALYVVICRRRCFLAACILACGLFPSGLAGSHVWEMRDDTMAWANKTNMLIALLGTTRPEQHDSLLQALGLPGDCRQLAGNNWRTLDLAHRSTCSEAGELRYTRLALLFVSHPGLPLGLITEAIPRSQRWVVGYIGQVAGQRRGQVADFQWSLSEPMKAMSAGFYKALFLAPLAACCCLLMWRCLQRQELGDAGTGLVLLVLLQWAVITIAVTGDGFADLARHTHLAGVLLLAQACLWPLYIGCQRSNIKLSLITEQ